MQVNKFAYIENERPALKGVLRGSGGFQQIRGEVYVYWLPDAVYITAELENLPAAEVLGFHIHEGFVCAPIDDKNSAEPAFSLAGEHFSNCGGNGIWCDRHPYHAGDLPPVFSDSDGYANMQVYLDKASINELSGRTIIIHGNADDFNSQPSGGAGKRIACGVLAEIL